MKKLIFTMLGMLMLMVGFGQKELALEYYKDSIRTQVLRTFCTSAAVLDISTGQDGNGNLVNVGGGDPFWGGVRIANLTGALTPWNVINGAAILSPNTGNEVQGVQVFKRYFYTCGGTINFSGMHKNDNMLQSFVLKNATANILWQAALPPNDPQCYTANPFSGTANLAAGEYYFEFEYVNSGGYGGFSLQGSVIAEGSTLSNYPDCCCDCNKLPQRIAISGPTCFCWSRNCKEKLTYSIPKYDGPAGCFQYSWSAKPAIEMSGQGTNQIGVNCSALKPGNYTISVTISCGRRKVTSSLPLTICAKISPAFSTTMSQQVASFTPADPSGSHYWLLVTDNDNNCNYSWGEPITVVNGNPATANNLQVNKSYVMYHVVSNQCGKSCECWSYQTLCFKWSPAQYKRAAKVGKQADGPTMEGLESLPEALRKELQKRVVEMKAKNVEMDTKSMEQ